MKNHSRRNLLKIAGTATAIGFAGQVAATEKNSTEESTSRPHSIPYDLSVRNNDPNSVPLKVTLSEKEGGRPLFSRRFRLGARGSPSDVARESLDLPGGLYTVEATLGNDLPVSATWGVPPGGVPDWMGLSILVMPNGDINIYREEI